MLFDVPVARNPYISRLVQKFVAPAEARSPWLRFGLALLLPAVGFFLTWQVFNPSTGPYFTLFMASVVATSLFGGTGPGIVDTILSTILGFLVSPPAWTLRLTESEDAIRIALFCFLGLLISTIVGVVGELQRDLNRERGRLREILANAPAAIGVMRDPEHRWEYLNSEYVRV